MRIALVLGAVLLIVGVAGRIIVPEHAPRVYRHNEIGAPVCHPRLASDFFSGTPVCGTYGWSKTVYDGARIATWAALIVGAILALFGLSISVRGSRLT